MNFQDANAPDAPERWEPKEVADACRQKFGEAHDAHMHLNGDCPWCGSYDKSKWLKET